MKKKQCVIAISCLIAGLIGFGGVYATERAAEKRQEEQLAQQQEVTQQTEQSETVSSVIPPKTTNPLIEWCIPPTVRRNIHAEVMTEHLVQSPLIFIFEAVDAQFTGLFPLWAPVRHIDLGITAFEFTRPLSTGAKTLPHVHHDTHLLCGDAFRILEFTFTSDTSFFS